MSHPPMESTQDSPGHDDLTINLIWSQCPASMIRGDPPGLTAAITFPCQSVALRPQSRRQRQQPPEPVARNRKAWGCQQVFQNSSERSSMAVDLLGNKIGQKSGERSK
jgi:hypothetical protein